MVCLSFYNTGAWKCRGPASLSKSKRNFARKCDESFLWCKDAALYAENSLQRNKLV